MTLKEWRNRSDIAVGKKLSKETKAKWYEIADLFGVTRQAIWKRIKKHGKQHFIDIYLIYKQTNKV